MAQLKSDPTRRDFLKTAAALAAGHRFGRSDDLTVVTVRGPVKADSLGPTLPHEHVLVDFIGADRIRPGRYDRAEVFRIVRPYLREVRALGCRTLCECTPAFLGRDVQLLLQLSRASGIHLVTNTGLYGAANDRYVPGYARRESAEELAERWTREFTDGIEGTSVRPGFVKIGVDPGPLSPIDRKLVVAAARTHRATGLTIAAHTGNGTAALEQMEILSSHGVATSAWIWVHAQNEPDLAIHEQVARAGGWVEFDGLSDRSVDRYVKLLEHMRSKGLLHRVLVSHDAGWYHVGEPGGGRFRPYTTLYRKLLPELRRRGWTDAEVHQLTVANPAEAFAVRRRLKT